VPVVARIKVRNFILDLRCVDAKNEYVAQLESAEAV
jgi:hypothetical protein